MLENVIYDILELPYPKIDTQELKNKVYKLNSTEQLIHLGTFQPLDIDIVVEEIEEKRKTILDEIRQNSEDLGFELEENLKLMFANAKITTYENFLKKFNESYYFQHIDEWKSDRKAPFILDKETKQKAIEFANYKTEQKGKKFEVTPRDIDRFEEKYYKEYITKAEKIHNDKEKKRLEERKESFQNFKKRYTSDLDGYKKYIENKEIYKLLQEDFDFFIPYEETKRHIYISGATGSGKSEILKLLIYSNILKKKKGLKLSTVLIEPHGDLSDEVIKFKENYKNNDLIYIHPYLDKEYTITINPFELKKEEKTEHNVEVLASEILNVFKLVLGSSFTLPMESVLLPCIVATIYLNDTSKENYAGIETLQRFMDDENNKDLIEFSKSLPNINHQNFFKNGFKNKSLSVTKQALYTKIQTLLNSNAFSKLVQGKSTIDLENELNSGKTIIINLSKGLMGDMSSKFFGSLITALINHIVLKRVHQKKENRIPIHLLIDESQNYLTSSTELALTELRKYGLHLTLANQTVGQNSNAQLEKIILSNTNIKIVGMNATDSLDKLSREIQVPTTELQELTVGEFFIKIGNRKAIKFTSSTNLLNNTNSILQMQFEELKKDQLQKYYKNINEEQNIVNKQKDKDSLPITKENFKNLKPKYSLQGQE